MGLVAKYLRVAAAAGLDNQMDCHHWLELAPSCGKPLAHLDVC